MRKTSTSARPITEERLDELKHNALDIMCDVRRSMLNRHAFVGSVAMNLDIVPTRDIDNPTACTDGSAIYFDIDFLASLKPDEREFVFAHEVWHNVMLHAMRREGRDHSLFNIATDLEINQILKKDGFIAPKNLLWPDKYGFPYDLSAEEYYELLEKNPPKYQQIGSDPNGAGGNGDGQFDGQFDKHIYVDAVSERTDAKSMNVADKYGKVENDDDFRPMATESAVEKIREAAVTAAQEIERMCGSLPGYLEQIVKGLLEPEMNWKDVLTAHVTRVMGDKTNWNTPNRRFAYNGMYLPAHTSDKLRIAVGIDTSGSTNEDLPKFLTELNALVQSFGNYELHVIQCDTEVKDCTMYDDSNPLDLENNEFKMRGGGGTRLQPIFDYIAENDMDIDSICIFTDGFCEVFDADMAPNYPVLWLVSSAGKTDYLHFGEVIKFGNR